MKFIAPASPRLVMALGLAAVCGLGSVHGITAAHAQSTSAPAAASATTPPEVPAPSSSSATATAPAMTSPSPSGTNKGHRQGSQALNTYLTRLHQDLKVTSSEEPQWSAFADTMRDNATSLGQAYRTRREQLPSMDATQDLNSFIQVEQLRLDGLKKSADAFSALYAVMPADQKKVADAVFLSDLPGGPHHRGPAKAKPAQ
jgi:hypothetical protein